MTIVRVLKTTANGGRDRLATTFTTREWEDRIQLAEKERVEKLALRDARRREISSRKTLAMELARQSDRLEFIHSMLAELARHDNAALEVLDTEAERVERQLHVRQRVSDRRKETMQYLRDCV